MQFQNVKLFMMAVLITAVCTSCDDDNPAPEADITYPALYVVNGATNNLSVIELSSNTVRRTIALYNATFPHHISLSPDKEFIAVAITGMDLSGGHGGHGTGNGPTKVMILDAVTGEFHYEFNTNHLPHNAAFNPSGTELWVPQADTAQGTVLVYNTTGYTLKNIINVGRAPSELTFSFDGSMAFVANTMDATVTMIDPATKAVMATIPVGEDPVGAWPAPNGKMYVDNEADFTVTEIDVSNANVTSTFNLGFMPGYVSYSTHHNEVWVSDATNGRIVYFENTGGVWAPVGNISTGSNAHAIVFSNDGTRAYVSNQGADTVSVIDVVNHTKLQDITVGGEPNGMVIKN